MASLRDRLVAAYRAFREPFMVTQPQGSDDFGDFNARQLRYALYWAFFENNVYRAVHSWAHTYKIQFGLYRYIRNIYNPAHRLGVFWQTHLMGGLLDPRAGDGAQVPSALPIVTDNDALRKAIAELWKWSNWHVNKDIYTLRGAVFGDTALEIVDDLQRGRVYLQVVNPSIIKSMDLDPFGNVKGYVFEEERPHPDQVKRTVTYTETCERSGNNVTYRTYMNGKLFPWQKDAEGNSRDEWEEPYGFVPLVVVQHNNVGLDWGWSELHAGRGKFQEVDDLASKLSDQVRKAVDAKWVFFGVDPASSTPMMESRDSETYQESSSATDRPQPGREEIGALYGPTGGSAEPLIYPLNIADVTGYINDLLKELEREYPELQMDIWTASGDASGRALRVARQRAEAKVLQRRVAYDDALVRAQQMAVAIGGFRQYEGYGGFNLDSYKAGNLEHSIGKRTVFAQDPLDDIEIESEEWKAIGEATKTGVPLEFYLLEERGWDEEKVQRLMAAMEAGAWRGVERSPDWEIRQDNIG